MAVHNQLSATRARRVRSRAYNSIHQSLSRSLYRQGRAIQCVSLPYRHSAVSTLLYNSVLILRDIYPAWMSDYARGDRR